MIRFTLAIMAILAAISTSSAAERSRRPHTLIIVPAAQQKAANDAAVGVFGRNAKDTFSVGWHKGAGNTKIATHYVAAWPMSDAQRAKFAAALEKHSKARQFQIFSNAKSAKLKDLGLNRIPSPLVKSADAKP